MAGTSGPYYLTFNSATHIWSRTSDGIISYVYDLAQPTVGASGPYLVVPVQVPLDPVYQTGGEFWELKEGPNTGWLVSFWTNSLGYGSITVTGATGPTGETPGAWGQPYILADEPWRLLIKGMLGVSGAQGAHYLTFNSATRIWSRTNTGIISYVYDLANQPSPSSGTYLVNPIVVPYDPTYQTGGSFWELKEGPNAGWLVSFWSNTLGYGDISVTNADNFSRGPGATLLTMYHPNPHLLGASLKYNAAGELHFTLLVDDPAIASIAPKECHYAVEFLNVIDQTWHEVFAGVVWDIDATEQSVVYTGIDYLALLQTIIDDRYDPLNFNRPVPVGSKYVNLNISDVVSQHLAYSIGLPDSWVNWMTVGTVCDMLYKITIWSASQDSLSFILGLINSYRAGSGKNTRIYVQKTGDGAYQFNVDEDPGVNLDNLRVQYGQLAQGFHAIKFGRDWASRVNLIGRAMDPTQTVVRYESDDSAVDQGVWGRVGGAFQTIYTLDSNDLKRRALQAALDASRLGRQLSFGAKLGSFIPLNGWNICDYVPIQIDYGAVQTDQWSSDNFGTESATDPSTVATLYWTIFGCEFETFDDSHWTINLDLWPAGGHTAKSYPQTPFGYYPPLGTDPVVGDHITDEYGVVYYNKPGTGYPPTSTPPSLQPGFTGNDFNYGHFGVPLSFWGFPGTATPRNPPGWVDFGRCGVGNGINLAFQGNGKATIYLWGQSDISLPKVSVDVAAKWMVNGVIETQNIGTIQIPTLASAYITVEVGLSEAYAADEGIQWIEISNFQDGHGSWDGNIGFDGVDWEEGDSVLVTPRPPVQYGSGVPPSTPTDTSGSIYYDQLTGIEYILSADGTTYTPVAGSGFTASGKVDFTFAAATTWVIVHALDGYPRVTLLESGGQEMDAQIVYDSTSQITVSFFSGGAPVAVAGSAHLSIG